MRAMVLHRRHERLTLEERPDPAPGPGQIRVRIEACGVCRTDLHVVDGELPKPKLPIVPGHEIVGRVVCGGIHMSDIPSFPYSALWEERSVASVANLTRADGHEFLGVAVQAKVRTTTTRYSLDKANEALDDLRSGRLEGAAVLAP